MNSIIEKVAQETIKKAMTKFVDAQTTVLLEILPEDMRTADQELNFCISLVNMALARFLSTYIQEEIHEMYENPNLDQIREILNFIVNDIDYTAIWHERVLIRKTFN